MSKLGIWADYGAKIVCNELRRQELISFQDWVYDATHCARSFSSTSYLGYRLWAIPCLRLMRRYPSLAKRLAVVVRWMVADLKYEIGISKQRHFMGRVMRRGVFWPMNRLLGCLARLFWTDVGASPGRPRMQAVGRCNAPPI